MIRIYVDAIGPINIDDQMTQHIFVITVDEEQVCLPSHVIGSTATSTIKELSCLG